MPIIPEYTAAPQGQWRPATPSIGAAAAPGRAMQAMGAAIQGVGDMAGEMADKIQRGTDLGIKSRAGLAMQNAYAEHQEFRIQNPDESLWEDDIKMRIGKSRQSIDFDKASPAMRAELDATFQGWESESVHGTRLDGMKYKRAKDRTSYTQLREEYIKAGKFDEVEKMDDEAAGAELFSEGETKANKMEAARLKDDHVKKQGHLAAIAEIDADWVSAAKKYESPTPPEGVNPTEYALQRDHWKQRKANGQREIIQTITDGMSAEDPEKRITSSETVRDFQDELGPTLWAKVSESIDKQNAETIKQNQKNPAYQKQMIAILAANVDDIDQDDIEGQFTIQQQIKSLEDGPIRSNIEARLKDRIEGNPPKTTPVNSALRVIRGMLDNNGYGNVGKVEEEQATSDAVKDGFLKNKEKLGLLFSKDVAEEIATGKKYEDRLGMFLSAWPKRNTSKDNPADYTLRTAKAIAEGRDKIPRAEAEIRKAGIERLDAYQRHGADVAAFLKWAYDNPKKAEDPIETDKAMLKIIGSSKSQAYINAAIFQSESALDGGVLYDKNASPLDPITTLPQP